MSSIQRLSDDVINKIAAGEVVERPASVVKELCENAIDAQASQIHVTLQSGGTEGISINDNGKGISSDQALLAFERHATSKLQCADDLFAIASMGFRGEALASIAAVSKLQMTTRIADADSGTRVVIEGGALKANERWAGAQGTTIAVNELFYNVPARRAFLKSPTTELSHVVEMLQMLSLAHPEISFEVENNGKARWRCDAVSSQEESGSELLMGELALRQRVSDIWSQEISNKLIYAQRTGEFAHMEALFSTPGNHRGNARQQVIVVNGRVIKDRGIKSAIHRAFHSHILPGQYPSIILNFQIPASLIDVNVHPA